MKADYVHKDTLTATDYVELNKNNKLLVSYNQALLKENQDLKKANERLQRDETDMLSMNETSLRKISILKTQQKEFIKFLEDGIKSSSTLDTINKQTAMYIYSTTLRKYRSITGVSDENT